MNIDLHIEKDAETAAQQAAKALEEAIAGSSPVLLLLSGGSPLEILKYVSSVDPRVTVSVSDDRFSTDPAINNFAQIQSLNAQHWIDTRPLPAETVEDVGHRFDVALKKWKQDNPTGKIVMTQGIGLDGHTVGIMPGCIFEDPDVWAVGYDAKEKNKYPLRVTVTMPFLRMVDDSILYVCGPDKKRPLEDTLRVTPLRGGLSEMPARIIHEMKHCLLFTDQPVDRVDS